jgi:thiol-disulfide isomerase/thioredoxin
VNRAARLTLGIGCMGLAALGGVATHYLLAPHPMLRVSASKPSLPYASVPASARPIPMVLPEVSLPDAEGVSHHLSEWSGHPLIINFWATWCEPCRREIPLLIKLRHERAASEVAVVGIAIDLRAAVAKYAAAAGIDYPLLIGEKDGFKTVDAFGMQLVFPFSVFADRRSRVVAVKVGELHEDEAQFILDRIDDVDRGTLALAAAREAIETHLRDLAVARAKRA